MSSISSSNIISAILRHDKKITSYKIALLRAINDVAPGGHGIMIDSDCASKTYTSVYPAKGKNDG
jgi:hypothetical protein